MLCLFILSCDNEIDILSGDKQIPIVYGIVDLSDTATYIRVEKSFADPNIPPIKLAEDPSILYYDNIIVRLSDVDNKERTYQLTRVDGNKEGYVREEGPFAEAPNYLYKIITDSLRFNSKTRAKIEIINTDKDSVMAYATTNIVDKIMIGFPTHGNTKALRLVPDDEVMIRLESEFNPLEISYYIASLSYVVNEYDEATDKLVRRVPQVIYSGKIVDRYDIEIPSKLFFTRLSNTFEPNPNVYRNIDSAYFQVDCFGLELNEYKNIQLLNSGITSSSIIPVYNNIDNGRGLFTSSGSDKSGPFRISQFTYNEINSYPGTENLSFEQ